LQKVENVDQLVVHYEQRISYIYASVGSNTRRMHYSFRLSAAGALIKMVEGSIIA
jgi:hypothetical protein